jgi:hypothetical protein
VHEAQVELGIGEQLSSRCSFGLSLGRQVDVVPPGEEVGDIPL